MRPFIALLFAAILGACAQQPVPEVIVRTKTVTKYIPQEPTIEEQKRAIVAASIYGYEISTRRTCPCPYSKEGECKGQSAYDRSGGAEPKCYTKQVTAGDLRRWRELVRTAPDAPAKQ